jgi:hypothetical protein
MFDFPSKSDQEQYDFMIRKSEEARLCQKAWLEKNSFDHAVHIIELVKIGYSRNEIYSFLRILYKMEQAQ